jgi:hypothetical protein
MYMSLVQSILYRSPSQIRSLWYPRIQTCDGKHGNPVKYHSSHQLVYSPISHIALILNPCYWLEDCQGLYQELWRVMRNVSGWSIQWVFHLRLDSGNVYSKHWKFPPVETRANKGIIHRAIGRKYFFSIWESPKSV